MARVARLGNCLLLLFVIMVVQEDANGGRHGRARTKREWVIPPPHLEENKDYTRKTFIAKVRSDKEEPTEKLIYNLRGPGADQPPMKLFVLNQTSGFVRITGILDREAIANYTLFASAQFKRNGTPAEDDLKIKIVVTDVNDNAPVFLKSGLPDGSVHESSPIGTLAAQVHATDADQADTPHTDLRYEIIKQQPKSKMMFYIEPKTGKIKVKEPTLDRETQEAYNLTVKATDMGGLATGLTGTGTVTIMILDINDNRPVLDNTSYAGEIEENAGNIEVMRLKASDRDQVGTDNWRAKYEIVSGNEDGYFSIETDPKTNEGVLKLNKPVDYENIKEIYMEVAVDNEAPYQFTYGKIEGAGYGEGEGAGGGEGEGAGEGGGAGGVSGSAGRKKYPVVLKVKNLPDGPKFVPAVKPVTVSEDKEKITVPMVLTTYQAVDEDSGKIAKNVRYAKGSDPASWLAVDSDTGEITLTRVPDRESKYVVDGIYYAKILCITEDLPAKTATGTVAVHIEDVNEHCPELTSSRQSVCTRDKAVYVTAHDRDSLSSGPPFTFQLLSDGTSGAWDMRTHNDNTVVLTARDSLQPRPYAVAFQIKDREGHACPEPVVLDLVACDCFGNGTCRPEEAPRHAAALAQKNGRGTFGGPVLGILAGVLLLLLLVPLLLLSCSSESGLLVEEFANSPFEAKEQLIIGHTEGLGEDKDVSLMAVPILSQAAPVFGAANVSTFPATGAGNVSADALVRAANAKAVSAARTGYLTTGSSVRTGYLTTGSSGRSGNLTADSTMRGALYEVRRRTFKTELFSECGVDEEDALPRAYLEEYYSKKASRGAEREDSLRAYEYEGQSSSAGSVSSCSELEVDRSLDFLDGLDSKFRTLAQICRRQDAASEVTTASVAATATIRTPPPSPAEGVSVEKVNLAMVDLAKVNMEKVNMEKVNVEKVNVEKVKVEKVNVEKVNVEKVNVEKVNVAASSASPRRLVHEEVVLQDQAFVIPQPVYLAAAPVVQTQYVVRPQVQQTVLVPDALQGLYVVSDGPAAEKVVVQESRVVAGPGVPGGAPVGVPPGGFAMGEGLVLVRNAGSSHEVHRAGTGPGLVQMGGPLSGAKNVVLLEDRVLHGSQLGLSELNGSENMAFVQRGERHGVDPGENVVLVDSQVGAGQVQQGGRLWIQPGTLPRGTVYGSQNILLVEREGAAGQVLGSPVSPQQILLAGPAGLSPGSVQVTSPENVFDFERRVRSGQGTMELGSDAPAKRESAV